jgi:hypothetical protein
MNSSDESGVAHATQSLLAIDPWVETHGYNQFIAHATLLRELRGNY